VKWNDSVLGVVVQKRSLKMEQKLTGNDQCRTMKFVFDTKRQTLAPKVAAQSNFKSQHVHCVMDKQLNCHVGDHNTHAIVH
jgi:hypothetical protein